jgi:hypothetical protein
MSQINAHLDFSEKAKRINTIAPFAYENPIYEPSTHSSVTEQEEPMDTTQNQTYSVSIPHPLAEILLNIPARTSVANSNNSQ